MKFAERMPLEMKNPRESRLRVAIRIRPSNIDASSSPAHIACSNTSVTVTASNTHSVQQQTATLGTSEDPVVVFSPGQSNDNVASRIDVSAMVRDCARGDRDGLVCCYGQSYSGKSYTMFGQGGGLVHRALQASLGLAAGGGGAAGRFRVQVSAYELYGHTVRSLMGPRHGQWMRVTKSEDINTVLELVVQARAVSETNLNTQSSRSHAFVIVRFESEFNDAELGGARPAGPDAATPGATLALVDLAGSERVSKSQATGARLQEGIEINKSLSALGNVMRALASASPSTSPGASTQTIPWRASKLTQLLKAHLRCHSTIWFILCISGEEDHAHESLSTLRFGSAVLGVTLRAHRKEAKGGRGGKNIQTAVDAPAVAIRDAVAARHWVMVYLCWLMAMIMLALATF